MTEPCAQAPTIERIHQTLDRVVDALEELASTNLRIDHVEEDGRRRDKEIENLFLRTRELELIVGKDGNGFKLEVVEAMDTTKTEITKAITDLKTSLEPTVTFVAILRSNKANYVFSALFLAIVMGTICDIVYHYDMIKKVWGLVK